MRAGVPRDVAQRLLRDPVHQRLGLLGQALGAGDVQAHEHPLRLERREQVRQRRLQALPVQRGRVAETTRLRSSRTHHRRSTAVRVTESAVAWSPAASAAPAVAVRL